MTIEFYVTPLDPSCAMVLGYNWLTRHNPLIDWVLGSIIFRPQPLDRSIPTLTSSARTAKLPPQNPPVSDNAPGPSATTPKISLVGASAFLRGCKRSGTRCFKIHLSDTSASAKSASVPEEAPDLSSIPKEYHDYADVFSKAEACKLAPHRPYDLQINLEEGTVPPPITTMYSLSKTELELLREFIDENLTRGFIRSTSSPYGAPVLFSLNNNGTL